MSETNKPKSNASIKETNKLSTFSFPSLLSDSKSKSDSNNKSDNIKPGSNKNSLFDFNTGKSESESEVKSSPSDKDSLFDFNSNKTNLFESNNDIKSESNTSWSIIGFFSSISWMTWVAIILLLAFLGINVFVYLAQGTQDIASIFKPIFAFFTNILAKTTQQITSVSAQGATAILQAPLTQTTTVDGASTSVAGASTSVAGASTLHQDLQKKTPVKHDYEPDESHSSIQASGKAGWCYIGEDRGFRSCAYVKESDKCISGQIFPSKEICVNPNLRP
jgi:hypothetical protein